MIEFFPFKKDIPFMRWGRVTTFISLATFILAVAALATKGLHLGVDFTGGTLMEVAYKHPADNRETTPGRAIRGIHKARIRIGAIDKTIDVDPTAHAAVYTIDLPAGPAELQTWLISSDGTERGAYFVYVRRA